MQVDNFFSQRGFGQKMGFGKFPAICVIEMINAFTDPTMPLGMDQSKQIEVINKILDAGRLIDIPVFFGTVEYSDKNLADAGLWYLKQKGLATLKAGTREVQVDSHINKKTSDQTISRKFASMFFGTDFGSRLNYYHVDTLIIAGCSTSGCVRATAVDTISHGYRPIVVLDAVADRDLNAHNQSLIDLETRYADVIKSNEVIKYLQSLNRKE